MNKLKLSLDKTEFLLIGKEQQWSKYLSLIPIEIFVSKLTEQNLLGISEYFLKQIHLPLTYICSLQLMFLPYPGPAVYWPLP